VLGHGLLLYFSQVQLREYLLRKAMERVRSDGSDIDLESVDLGGMLPELSFKVSQILKQLDDGHFTDLQSCCSP
jgi:hypothetical protein